MKVLLIRPQAPNTLSFINILDNEPLELEYIYTQLTADGMDCYIYDGIIEKTSVKDTVIREKPDVIAISGYITQEKIMTDYCTTAKSISNEIITIIGGVHAQLNYQRLYHKDVDYIYRSEGLEDLSNLITGKELSTINGLVYKEDNQYIVNELTPIDIDSLPIPDRSFFHKNKHHYKYLHLQEIASLKTSFSCPYSCNFCYCTLLASGKYRCRDLNKVIEEIKTIPSDNIQIVDDDFLVDRDRLITFAQMLIDNDIKKTFLCYARADFISRNPDIVQLLTQVGFKYFLVGIEAIGDNQLKAMNKQTSMDDNRRCIQIVEGSGANLIALMIAGIDADKAYFDGIYDFVVETGLRYVTVSIFTPIPGTPLYDQYKDRITNHNIEDYDFLHLVLEPEKISSQTFYLYYYQLFLGLYKIAKKSGIYDFMDLDFYKGMLSSYLQRVMKGQK